MSNLKLTDALEVPIENGWCAQVDDSRGSVRVKRRFIIGITRTKVILLGSAWFFGSDNDYLDLVNSWKQNPDNPDLPRYTKIPTRIIQLKEHK
jgi:hypothetical protein